MHCKRTMPAEIHPQTIALCRQKYLRHCKRLPADRGGKGKSDMTTIRLAIVWQKYRPDGGAERFISRALKALDNSGLELNIITR